MKISMAHLLFPIAVIIFFILLMGCGNYTPPKVASHVVAVTLEGDTILVPIERIRPNMYNSYYPVYRNYYYNDFNSGINYHWRYRDNRGTSGNSSSGNTSSGSKVKSVPTPSVPIDRPSAETLLKVKK